MSFTKEVVLWCDHCGTWDRFETTTKVSVARRLAKKGGWTRDPSNQKDFCPYCKNTGGTDARRCRTQSQL